MIVVRTAYFEHKYPGEVLITHHEENGMIFVSAHTTIPTSEGDELDVWSSDVFDAFKVEDVISIQGVD